MRVKILRGEFHGRTDEQRSLAPATATTVIQPVGGEPINGGTMRADDSERTRHFESIQALVEVRNT